MSSSPLHTLPVPPTSADVPPQPMHQPVGGNPRLASGDQVLSWEAAMGRAEQGEMPASGATNPLFDTTGAAGTAGANGSVDDPATKGWSPMNPQGEPTANAPGEAPINACAQDSANAQALSGEGVAGQGGHLSPEELLQRKWDRIALGLEPGAVPTGGAGQELLSAASLDDAAMVESGVSLAQPATLLQPIALGWQGLSPSERPVADGMTVGEIATERHVEAARADAQAYDAAGASAAEQARLAEINTPETLPEQTIESV